MNNRPLPPAINRLPLRVDPRRIGYLRFILEGYDGMALISTINATAGEIVIRYPESFQNELMAIIDDVAPQIFTKDAE